MKFNTATILSRYYLLFLASFNKIKAIWESAHFQSHLSIYLTIVHFLYASLIQQNIFKRLSALYLLTNQTLCFPFDILNYIVRVTNVNIKHWLIKKHNKCNSYTFQCAFVHDEYLLLYCTKYMIIRRHVALVKIFVIVQY